MALPSRLREEKENPPPRLHESRETCRTHARVVVAERASLPTRLTPPRGAGGR